MKIIKYSKVKNNQYKIEFDNQTEILLYEDLIVEEELLRKKELTLADLNKYLSRNDEYEAYYEILKFLRKKLRCEKEIIIKFQNIYSKELIEKSINRLKKANYLNDNNYLKAYINDKIILKLEGPLKIRNELLNLDFEATIINEYLDFVSADIWLSKIKKIVTKSFKSNKKSLNHWLYKTKLDLINRGFERETIDEYLQTLDLKEDNELIKKELKKLQLKYKDDYIIKNKLILKGFLRENVESIMAEAKEKF